MLPIILIIIAVFCEFIDSYLGMMYGTILSPLLIILGYNPVIVVPSILFSQAIGGFIASYKHHKLKNAVFNFKSKDLRIAFIIFIMGAFAVLIGVRIGTSASKNFLNTYIGVLCVIMGVIVLIRKKFRFSWTKITILGVISSFNKALSGGGFGPIVASGQIISGRKGKESIGTTDFAEAPICILSFVAWVTLMKKIPDLNLLIPLTVGSMAGGYFGPVALSRFKSKRRLIIIIGILAMSLGIWTLLKTWVM